MQFGSSAQDILCAVFEKIIVIDVQIYCSDFKIIYNIEELKALTFLWLKHEKPQHMSDKHKKLLKKFHKHI